jgi:zinc transport system permease protein
MLRYGFVQRALIAGTFIALSCAGLGAFLVLRRFSMIGDGLAHVGFAAVALAFVLGFSPFFVSVPVVMLMSLCILKLG